ncbi:MAG: hypothetical protein GF320_00815, partial [Armatimonadia bacterium]|nr:hypothetical protein [Armatimonadia bacterium]
LLDGTGSALVSTDTTKLTPIITGETVDEGNYRLEQQMTPGQGVVMKSDIFRVVEGEQYRQGNRGLARDIRSSDVAAPGAPDPDPGMTGIIDLATNPNSRLLDASDFTLWQDLDWSVAPDEDNTPGSPNKSRDFQSSYQAAPLADQFGVSDFSLGGVYTNFTLATGGALSNNDTTQTAPYLLMEVTGVRADETVSAVAPDSIEGDTMVVNSGLGAGAQLVSLRISAFSRDGELITQSDFELDTTDWIAANDLIAGAGYGNLTDYGNTTIQMGSDGDKVTVGDQIVLLYDNTAQYGASGTLRTAQDGNTANINADNFDWSLQAAAGIDLGAAGVEVNRVGAQTFANAAAASMAGLNFSQSVPWLDGEGTFHVGTGDIRFSDFDAAIQEGVVQFNLFETTLAERVTELTWVDRFQEGISLFDTGSQTITVYVGNRRADLVLQPSTTMEEVADKLSRIMATSAEMGGLGFGVDGDFSSSGVDGNIANFVTDPTVGTDEALAGTLVFRSPVPGPDGRIWFSGNDQLIDGFSWAEVKSATENTLDVTVYDAHTSRLIGRQKVNDSVLRSIIDGVDVKIEQSADVRVQWDSVRKQFLYYSDFGKEVSHLHVVDNPLSLQLGANPGQSLEVRIGSVTRGGLQLDDLLVVSKEAAEEAVQKIDRAVVEVAEYRASIGAYINRLNSTINIIDITQENLLASESRIRDLDMAKQTVEFTRDQVLVQAATAVLAQANVLPQSVLQLLQ